MKMINSIQTKVLNDFVKKETDPFITELLISNEAGNSLRASERRLKTETSRSFESEPSTLIVSLEDWKESFEKDFSNAYLEGRFEDAIVLIDQIDRAEIIQQFQAELTAAMRESFENGKEWMDPSQLQTYVEEYTGYFKAEINQGLDYEKACSYALLNRPQEALELYSHLECIGNQSLPNEILLSGGLFYLQNGDLEKAAAEFQKMDAMDSDAILILAVLGQKLGKDFLLGTDNSDFLADSLMQAGKYREAILELNSILSRFKEEDFYPELRKESEASYLATMSFCHAMLGEWEESSVKIKEAADLDLNPNVVLVQAAIALLEGDWSGAEIAEKHRLDPFCGQEYEPHMPLLLTLNLIKNQT
jgi:tetratricopeptide (TPR) repeat protein